MPHDHRYFRSIAALLSGVAPERRLPNWDWEQWIRTATEEGILAALHGCVQPFEFPTEIVDFLAGIEQLNTERNAQLLAEIRSQAALLNTAGIQPVLLKGGAYLLNGVYANPGRRYIADIDLLLANEDLPAANSLFQNAGYQADLSDPMRAIRHHIPPLIQNGRFRVELHHSLTIGKARHFLPAAEVLAASKPCDLGGAIVKLPCPEHLMTHLILHSQLHHLYTERIWPTLRSLYDLVLIQQRFGADVNWPAIQKRFRENGKRGILETHLRQVHSTLGMDLRGKSEEVWTHMRWLHRRTLWRIPQLRFVDPAYLYSSLIEPKINLGREMMKTQGGWQYILGTPFRAAFYRKLVADLFSR